MIGSYKTIMQSSEGQFKDRGSKFMAYCNPFKDPDFLKEFLAEIKSLHPKARHHCFAYRVGLDQNIYRYFDDGEPSGTAGRPILGAIDRYDLTDILIVVVRYFGGTKLGTSGLIQAYRAAAVDAIEHNQIQKRLIQSTFEFTVSYQHSAKLLSLLSTQNCQVINKSYSDQAVFRVQIPNLYVKEILLHLKAEIGQLHPEEINEKTKIDGFDVKQFANN